MRNTDLLEFGPLEDFANLCDIVKRHAKQYHVYEAKISQVSSMIPGQVQSFMEPLIKDLVVLQRLSVKHVKYKERAIEMKEVMLEDWLLSLMSTLVIGFGPQD
jgi:hypothetical protein